MKKTLIVLLLLSISLQIVACGKTKEETPTNEIAVEETISPKEDAEWSEKLYNVEQREALKNKMTKFDVGFQNIISFTYDGINREGIIFFPENVKDSSLIVMLHGSGMSVHQFMDMTNLHKEATSRGYTVLYLQAITNPDDKTSVIMWNNGTGNNKVDDIGFIEAAALMVEEKYELNSYKTNVIGFSNGGFMVHTLAAEGFGTFENFCCVAGDMQKHSWENKKETIELSFLEIFGLADDAVPTNATGTAKYSQAPAIEDVMDYYASSQNLKVHDPINLTDKLIEYTYDSPDSPQIIKGIAIKDCHHGWPEESLTTLNTNKYILDFFDSLK